MYTNEDHAFDAENAHGYNPWKAAWAKRLRGCEQSGRDFFHQHADLASLCSNEMQDEIASAHAESLYGRSDEEVEHFLRGFEEARDG